MLFTSNEFLLCFLPAALILYYVFFFSRKLQNLLLLIASLLFYAWGEPVWVLLLIGSILVNAGLGAGIGRMGSPKGKRMLLGLGVLFHAGMLFVLKDLATLWAQFGLDRYYTLTLPRPIGISFFTLQAISYLADVCRGEVKPGNPLRVGLHMAFFPKLIAGPLMGYGELDAQLTERKLSFDRLSVGFCRFAVGLGKKVLLAESFGAVADHVFNWTLIGADAMAVPASLAWLGSLAYALQIYFDFSGYSDMAIGLGLCFGFKLPENFNYPYAAISVTEFWKRWHISLTDWFRRYVYFPLGASRVANRDVAVRNLIVVWLLTGAWHGVNWTFLFWGLAWFVLVFAESFTGFQEKLPRFLRRLYTLLAVDLLWVVFRAESLFQAGQFFRNMFGLNENGFRSDVALMLLRENWLQFLLGILLCLPVARMLNERMYRRAEGRLNAIATVLYPLCMLALLILCVSVMTKDPCGSFIYFDF